MGNVFVGSTFLCDRGHYTLKCYCGFVCQTENELKEHVLKVHGARDGDWKGWISH
jgi:hypothetical protein